MPMDSNYYGAIGTGPLGVQRPGLVQRREMRQALRQQFGNTTCPTCNNGFSGGMDVGYTDYGGMQTGMGGGSHCPTCQQNSMMSPQMMGGPVMEGEYMDAGQMQPMMVPTPAHRDASVPSPMPSPAPPSAPGAPMNPSPPSAALPSTSYYQPGYPQMGGTVYSPPPQIQPFTPAGATPVQQTLYAP